MVGRAAREVVRTIKNLIICWCVWVILDTLAAIIKGGNKKKMSEQTTITIDIYEYRRICELEGKLDAVRAYCQQEQFPDAETMAAMLGIAVRKPLELYTSSRDTVNPYQE